MYIWSWNYTKNQNLSVQVYIYIYLYTYQVYDPKLIKMWKYTENQKLFFDNRNYTENQNLFFFHFGSHSCTTATSRRRQIVISRIVPELTSVAWMYTCVCSSPRIVKYRPNLAPLLGCHVFDMPRKPVHAPVLGEAKIWFFVYFQTLPIWHGQFRLQSHTKSVFESLWNY